MIGSLKGIVEVVDGMQAIIDTGGVGYRVLLSNDALSKIKVGDLTKLFTYTHVREDTLELYGFLNLRDLKLFEKLIGVSGIGPKTAMGIFSVGTVDEIIGAISTGDAGFFTGVPRLGTKNAQKIIIELKSKFDTVGSLDFSDGFAKENDEVLSALKTFGFTTKEIQQVLKQIHGKAETTEEKIKLALKRLGK